MGYKFFFIIILCYDYSVLPVERNTRKSFRLGHALYPSTPSQHIIKIFPVNLVAVEPHPPAKDISPEHQYFSLCSSKKPVFESHSRSVCPSGNPSPRQCFEQRVFRFLRRGLSHPQRKGMSGDSNSSECPSSQGLPPLRVQFKGPFQVCLLRGSLLQSSSSSPPCLGRTKK